MNLTAFEMKFAPTAYDCALISGHGCLGPTLIITKCQYNLLSTTAQINFSAL